MERIPQPIMDKRGEPHMRRFQEQRWLLDNTIRANGIDWDQPRSIYISSPCGPEGTADIVGVREPDDAPSVLCDLDRHTLAHPAEALQLVMRDELEIPFDRVGHAGLH